MKNELQVFSFQNSEVRTLVKNDEVWFVGKDLTDVLGYSNGRKAISDHVDEEDKGVTKCDTHGGIQNLTVINESGMYSLVLSSKLPQAKKFKRWVTSEVLPSIRKTGGYQLPTDPMEVLKLMYEAQNQTNNRVLLVENKLEGIKDIVSLSSDNWRNDCEVLIKKIADKVGGYQNIKFIRSESYKLLNERMGVDVQRRLKNMRIRMAYEGMSKTQQRKVTTLDVIDADKKLVQGYLAVIKDMAVHYGIDDGLKIEVE